MKVSRMAGVMVAAVALLIYGCMQLDPGADPVVVNAERTLTVGKATFDMVLAIDHADRGFWKSNAPAFHNFCNTLRVPQGVAGTNILLPRDSALLWDVTVVKKAYQEGKATGDELRAVLDPLAAALGQATVWLTLITNKSLVISNQ